MDGEVANDARYRWPQRRDPLSEPYEMAVMGQDTPSWPPSPRLSARGVGGVEDGLRGGFTVARDLDGGDVLCEDGLVDVYATGATAGPHQAAAAVDGEDEEHTELSCLLFFAGFCCILPWLSGFWFLFSRNLLARRAAMAMLVLLASTTALLVFGVARPY